MCGASDRLGLLAPCHDQYLLAASAHLLETASDSMREIVSKCEQRVLAGAEGHVHAEKQEMQKPPELTDEHVSAVT